MNYHRNKASHYNMTGLSWNGDRGVIINELDNNRGVNNRVKYDHRTMRRDH